MLKILNLSHKPRHMEPCSLNMGLPGFAPLNVLLRIRQISNNNDQALLFLATSYVNLFRLVKGSCWWYGWLLIVWIWHLQAFHPSPPSSSVGCCFSEVNNYLLAVLPNNTAWSRPAIRCQERKSQMFVSDPWLCLLLPVPIIQRKR